MKLSRPVIYALLATVVAAAFILTSEDPAATGTGRTRKRATSTSKADSRYTERDYEVNEAGNQFPVVNQPVKNAFKPLVVRDTGSAEPTAGPMGVPVVGDPNWIYTGMAEVDGVPMALLENSATKEGVFLKQSERWKGLTIYRIKPDELVVMDGKGALTTIRVNILETAPTGAPGTTPGAGLQPIRPPLNGPIGNGLAIRPESSDNRVAGDQDTDRNGREQGTRFGDED